MKTKLNVIWSKVIEELKEWGVVLTYFLAASILLDMLIFSVYMFVR